MKNYITSSKITLISGLITVLTATAIFAVPASAMAGGYNRPPERSYYPTTPVNYYPSTPAPVVTTVNTPVNVNTTVVNPTPTVITINNTNTNTNTVSGGGYSQPYVQPYIQPVVYSAPTPVYGYAQPAQYAYAPTYTVPTYYNDYSVPMNVNCKSNVTFSPVGDMVLWTAAVTGGNGYYTYAWSGSDQIYGTGATTDVSYNTPGQKYAAVTVYSSGQTVTATCSNIVTVGAKIYTNGNVTPPAPVYVAPRVVTRTVVRTVVAKPAVQAAAPTVAPAPTNISANSLFSLNNIPWGWVAILIILVLFGTVLYLAFNKNKI